MSFDVPAIVKQASRVLRDVVAPVPRWVTSFIRQVDHNYRQGRPVFASDASAYLDNHS